jgi:hypothetical protein
MWEKRPYDPIKKLFIDDEKEKLVTEQEKLNLTMHAPNYY